MRSRREVIDDVEVIYCDHDGEIRRTKYYGPKDEFGKPVERTKAEFPYSYDPFVVWGRRSPKCNGSAYSDRLWQWDHAKTDLLWKKHGLTSWCTDITKLTAFLKEWHDAESLELLQIVEYCNAGGYSLWRLDFHWEKKK